MFRFNRHQSPLERANTTQQRVLADAARPLFEGLETRVLHAVLAGIDKGVLRVTDTAVADTITLDHSGSTTFVNDAAFDDAKITGGIKIVVGSGVDKLDTVNIKATVKSVTLDGQFDVKNLN